MVKEGQLLWTPRAEFAQASNLTHYTDWLRTSGRHDAADYDALWRWSVSDLEGFWSSLWDYFEVRCKTPYSRVLGGTGMMDAQWFEGSRVNYTEHLLRYEERAAPGETVFHHLSEFRPLATMSWQDFVNVVKMPKAVLVGLLCQFTIMPFVGCGLATGFGFPAEIAAACTDSSTWAMSVTAAWSKVRVSMTRSALPSKRTGAAMLRMVAAASKSS